MKKKLCILVLAVLAVIMLAFGLTACKPVASNHTHNYSWVDNGDGTHKQHCQNDGCDEPDINVGSHDFTNGNCICGAEKPVIHTHAFTQKNAEDKYLATAASCTAKAVYYYSCECGEKSTETFEYGETLPHTGGTATCTNKAICVVCGNEYGELSEHSYTKEIAESKYLKTEATCTHKAEYYKSCECGEKGTETFEYGETLPHAYGEWHTVTPATCEEKGEKKRVCGVCGTEDTEEISAINHDWNEPTYDWAADYSSCTASRTCKNDSSHIESETATAELRTTVQATDSAFGECNYIVNFKNAAFTAAASPTFAVSADGVAYQPQESYEWTKDGDEFVCTVTKICVSDSAKNITLTAAVTFEEITPASCTKEGIGRYVAKFQNPAFATQYSENVVIPRRIHVVLNDVWGTDENGHWRYCEYGCGEKLSYADHTPGEWEITKDPTMADEGEQVKKCTVCDYVLETEVVPKLSNDWNGTAIAGSFEGGNGSINNPYLIKTGAQMKYLASLINSGTKGYGGLSYKLADNINLGGYEWDPIGCFYITSKSDYSYDYAFTGTFDGNGYVVSNFKITDYQKDYYQHFGLFGFISGATVKNLGVENFNIDISIADFVDTYTWFVGGLAGMIIDNSTITNCYTANGTVTGSSRAGIYAGGFAGGFNISTLRYCYSSATVTVTAKYVKAGGLIGDFYCSSLNSSDVSVITNSFATGNVTGILKVFSGSISVGNLFGRKSAESSLVYRYENQKVTRDGKDYYSTGVTKCTVDQLNDKNFYVNTLKWVGNVWDFSALDFENGQLPKLKPGITA